MFLSSVLCVCMCINNWVSFYSKRLKIKCHVTVAVTNVIEHLYDDTKVLVVLEQVLKLAIFCWVFSVLTKEYGFVCFICFWFFFSPQMNSEVIYGTRTPQKKTNPGSEKSSKLCEAVRTGLHLNGI